MSVPASQFENAREAEMLTRISPEAWVWSCVTSPRTPSRRDLMKALEEEKLLDLFSSPRSPARN